MKSRTWMWMSVMSLLAALVAPVRVVAQDNLPPNHHSHHQYRLIDLGTLGGPSSNVTSTERILNNHGTVACSADTPLPDPNNPGGFIIHSCQWRNGVLTDLGSLPGGNNSDANAINNRGLIIGWSENGVIDPLLGIPEVEAVAYKNGGIINLGTFGGNQSFGLETNNRDQVVGWALNTIPDPISPWGPFGTQMRAFLWQNGMKRDLGTLGGPDSLAYYVNDRSQVAGAAFTDSTINPVTGMPTLHPFFWEDGRMIDLGSLGGTVGSPAALNQAGQIAGFMNLAGDLTFHPFFWERGTLRDLGTFGGSTGQATWMNDTGDVVGVADLPGDQLHDAFLWRRGRMIDLGNLGKTSFADYVNSEDQVVGAARMPDGSLHGFLWENGGPMVDVNGLFPSDSGFHVTEALDINDRGEITGDGLPSGCGDQDTCGHAFLLVPCDNHHPGMCDDYSMVEVPDAVPAPRSFTASMQPGKESLSGTVQQYRNPLSQRYRIPGQRPIPRD
jgi:probable HAF family extracellular repeat protein